LISKVIHVVNKCTGGYNLFKAVIFDMDGVIIDSEPMHARAAILALKKFQVDVTKEYLEASIGSNIRYICSRMIEDFQIKNASVEDIIQANNEMKRVLLDKEGHITVPYAIELIKNLYDNKIKLIIASSSSCEEIEGVMDSLHIRQYFEGYVSGSNVANPKPAPDIFLKAVEKLGLSVDECIVIEDSFHGVTAAKAANIACIAYRNPHSGNQDLRGADILVEGFDEVDYTFVNEFYQQCHGFATILYTERTVIRELTMEDIPHMYQIYQLPAINKFVDYNCESVDVEFEKHKAYIQNVYRYYGYGLWGVFHKADCVLIGRCGIELKTFDGEVIYELGYLLDSKYHGQGYATEFVKEVIKHCFDNLHIPRIIELINKNNIQSINLATRVGMNNIGECKIKQNDCYKFEIIRS